MIKPDVISKSDQQISTIVKVFPHNTQGLLSSIYASPNLDNRLLLWDLLKKMAENFLGF